MLAATAVVIGVIAQRGKPLPAGKATENRTASPRLSPPRQTMPVSASETAKREATANAKPCDYTVITNLDLSRPPTQAELVAAGNLGEKLTPTHSADFEAMTDPVARQKQERDNLFFGIAIQAWNDHRYDEALKLFTEHLQSFPESPWAAESMLHIGCHHQYVARFSESVEWFDKILATAPKDTEMYHKAKLRRTILNIDLGKLDEATAGFQEMMRDDKDSNHQSYASYWLIQTELLKKNETALRDCGQKALSKAANLMGDSQAADTLYQLTAAGPHGYTAAELHATALMHGMESFPVQAGAALDSLPVPFIAHYTDRHYVTVESVTSDTVKLYDSRIATSSEMPRNSFEKNWSGFALLLKPAPANDKIHPAENLSEIIGGCCGQPTQVGDLGDSDDDCESCGLPTYSVNPVNMNFRVKDTPMWWDAPAGPPIYMTLLFNSQDSLNNYEPFGEKWSFEYVSYLLIAPGYNVQVKDGDGRLETFPSPMAGIPGSYPVTYQSPPGDFRVLTQTSLHNYTLTSQDGTEYHYGIPAAVGGNSAVPLLVAIKDRHNNTLSITHNANGAVTGVTHSTLPGESWDLVYATVGGSYSRVIRIDDPFGRSCHFSYDSQGRLTGQTDMGGLPYSYSYTIKNTIDNTENYLGQTAVPQLFIASITTPTGTTSVITEPADGIDTRSVTYTPEELAAGYVAYPTSYPYNSYPPPGKPMWTNYRITARDHLNAPTEYYFCGYEGLRYVRNPAQMQRAPGKVRPKVGARLELFTSLEGGKGIIYERTLYDENDDGNPVEVSRSNNGFHDAVTLVPRYFDDGNGGFHYVESNPQGKPTLIRLNNKDTEDQRIDITYIQPLGIDVDTISRKLQVTGGGYETRTLADYSYFPNRDVQSITDVTGRVLSYLWHPNGLPQQITDSATGDVILFTYDAKFRPYTTKVNGTVISTTAFDVDGKGTLQSAMGPDGNNSSYQYDNLNRLTRELRSDDSFIAYQWACCYIETTRFGKMVGGQEKTLRKTFIAHDARALPTSTSESDGSVTKYQYDNVGHLVQLTDPKNQITSWEYNKAGQLKKKTYPGGTTEKFTYINSSWGMGKIASFTNRLTQITSMSYHYDGLLSTVTKPTGEQSLSHGYDSWRRIKTITQNAYQGLPQQIHTFTHDDIGRVTSIDGPWSDDTIVYAYNSTTRSVTRTTPGGLTQTTTANAYGHISTVANILGTFTHNYDGLGGQLLSTTHTGANAGFGTAYTYHEEPFRRALASITSTKPGGAAVAKHSYTYDSLGHIQTWKREALLANPTGPTRQFDSKVFYDRADQVTSVIHTPLSGSSVAESAHHYAYDAAGNIASRQVEVPGAASTMIPYTHNSRNQIDGQGGSGGPRPLTVRGSTSEPARVKARTGAAGDTYKSARMLEGNRFEADLELANGANEIRLQARDASGNQANYTHALTLAAVPAVAPTYDANGNMLGDGIRSYQWDSQSRLVKITWGGSPVKSTEYRYNALGQRSEQIEKSGTAETAHYYHLYEGIRYLCRYTGGTAASNIDRQYLDQGEQRKTGSTWASYYYNRDHLGSIREVMHGDGTLAARYDYDPYGKRQAQYLAASYTGGCELGYTGHITQQSAVSGQGEIVLTLYRAYDPEIARWLSADPIGEQGGLNLYGYVFNDPINGWDPYGLEFWAWNGTAGAWAENATTFSAGLSDNVTMGLTSAIRGTYAGNNDVDKCSNSYKGGDWAGTGVGLAMGGGGLAKSLGKGLSTRQKLYEIGQKTLSKSEFSQYSHIADPVKRGIQMVRDQGWGRASIPSLKGLLTQSHKTIPTGLTPAAAREALSAAAGVWGTSAAGVSIASDSPCK